MGEVRCVRETVPVLRDLAGWLSWAMLDLPVPGGMRVNATASGETEETVDAQNGFFKPINIALEKHGGIASTQ